jgi:Tfp pilus assembly protein PilF
MLWLHKTGEAEELLNQAIAAGDQAHLALAYRSLLKRMKTDARGALEDAEKALRQAPDCFEAHAARAVALLLDPRRLVDAMESYGHASNCTPRDAEGHFLNLILYLLFTEMLINSVEKPNGDIELRMKLTPATITATRILEGNHAMALKEMNSAGTSLLFYIGMGLSFYRLGDYATANEAFRALLEESPEVPNARTVLSVKRLKFEAAKLMQG